MTEQPALPGMPAPAKAAKKGMDPWLLAEIKAQHPEAFGHHAHWRQCRCGAVVLHGADWTSDWAGEYDVDPARLTTLTELDSLRASRRTFEVIVRDAGKTLRSRDPWRIRAKAPETIPDPVCPLHRCHEPIGDPIPYADFTTTRSTP
jgi:hypothetical protein